MSERRAEYQTQERLDKPTRATEPITITLTRVEWARIAVGLRYVSKALRSVEELRLSRKITHELGVRGDEQDR